MPVTSSAAATFLIAATLAVGSQAADSQMTFVASREVILSYQAQGAAVDEVAVWVSTDRGATWDRAETERSGDRAVVYHAPRDDRFDFYLVLRNAAGASAPDPVRGAPPHATVTVDTNPPLLQVHRAETSGATGRDFGLRAQVVLVEENLAEGAIRVFYRGVRESRWIDGGPASITEKTLTWPVPADAPPALEVRVVVTDRAGNSTTVDLPESLKRPAPNASDTQPSIPFALDIVPGSDPDSMESATPLDRSTSAPAAPSASQPTLDVEAVRQTAIRYLSEGRFGLASARLQEALAVDPDNIDLRMLAGSAAYRSGSYDAAAEGYERVLKIRPDYPAALEGLALVAATQSRYRDARGFLERQLAMTPGDARAWLRIGDVEHRLGNLPAARNAWRKAAEARTAEPEVRTAAERRLKYFDVNAGLRDASRGQEQPISPSGRDLRR